jgi:hypothetical protein
MGKTRHTSDGEFAKLGDTSKERVSISRPKYPVQWAGVVEIERNVGGPLVSEFASFPNLHPFTAWALYRAAIEELRRGRSELAFAGFIVQAETEADADENDKVVEEGDDGDPVSTSVTAAARSSRHAARAVLDSVRSMPTGMVIDGVEVGFADGWISLRLFPDRATAEAWLRSAMPAIGAFEKRRGMGAGDKGQSQRPSKPLGPLKRADYDSLRQRLTESFDRGREQMAAELEQPLNDEASNRPHESYEEKKELAKWVNAELRRFGLALKCPKTGRPAILIGHATGVPGVGRFHIEVLGEEGVAKRTYTGVQLPTLELTLADLTWAKGSAARGRE